MHTHHDTIAGKKIVTYLNNPHNQEKDLIKFFEKLPSKEFHHYLENQTLMHFLIKPGYDINRCLSVIDILLTRAKRDSSLFQFLLTRVNGEHRSPLYESILHPGFEMMAHKISEWTLFGLKNQIINRSIYLKIHNKKNQQGNIPLTESLLHSRFKEIDIVLNEMNFAVDNGWISNSNIVLMLHHANHYNFSFIDIAFSSSCYQTIHTLVNHIGRLAFIEKACRNSVLDMLVRSGNSQALEVSFQIIREQIAAGKLSADIYKNIFLKIIPGTRANRIINLGFLPGAGEAVRVILREAEWANQNAYLSNAEYETVLLKHPNHDDGFNSADEAVHLANNRATYVYIKACLCAILNHKISLTSFQNMLSETNRHNYSVLHHAINNPSIEIAELFIHIFRTLMPKEIYLDLLMLKSGPKTNPLQCTSNKNQHDYKIINSLIENERKNIIQDNYDEMVENYYVSAQRQGTMSTELLDLIGLIRIVKNEFIKPRQTITMIAPTLGVTPPPCFSTISYPNEDKEPINSPFRSNNSSFSRVIAPPKKNSSLVRHQSAELPSINTLTIGVTPSPDFTTTSYSSDDTDPLYSPQLPNGNSFSRVIGPSKKSSSLAHQQINAITPPLNLTTTPTFLTDDSLSGGPNSGRSDRFFSRVIERPKKASSNAEHLTVGNSLGGL